jgi:membrane-associated PAP2 superfamily phosphatase
MDSGSFRPAALAAATNTRNWWLLHAGLPALAFMALFVALQRGGDAAMAHALYDASAGWPLDPQLPGSKLLYGGERVVVGAAVVVALGLMLAGFWHDGARQWQRSTGFVLVCLAVTLGLVAVGKHATNVDCPRALADYGGRYPFTGLFDDRPDAWPRSECFPAGHSSAGFAFVSLYFVLGAIRPRLRWAGLAAGLGFGVACAATQWARGMHFPSHDACSAAIAWAVALATYTALYRRRLRDARHAPAAD